MEENSTKATDLKESESQQELAAESKLGTMPVGRLLLNISLPIIFSMLVIALYNMVDSMFVAHLDNTGDALAALSFVAPVQNFMLAVSVGTGVGINSLLSRKLGERDIAAVNSTAVNGIFLGFLSWVGFALIGTFLAEPFMAMFAGGEGMKPEILEMGVTYMRIVTIGSVGTTMSIMYERLLQSTGRSMYTMATQLTGSVINLILDPIMIFGLFGFPAMGVAGAAWATIIGQCIGCVVAVVLNKTRNPEIHIKYRGFRPSWQAIKEIYKVGLPSIVMQSVGSVMVVGLNGILNAFGTIPVAVFNVYFKIQGFVVMPVLGLNNGMVPIIAYNLGARQRKRIERAVSLSVRAALCIMVAGTLLFWLLPQQLMGLFNAGEDMMGIGVRALRTISISFPIAAVCIVFSGTFQAMGKGLYSLMMSLIRQLVVLLPLAWLLARVHGLDSLWFAFPLAEVICLVVAVVLYRRLWRTRIRPLGEAAAAQ